MRHSTERPQVYDCRSSVKFDPGEASDADVAATVRKLRLLQGTTWDHNLGDGCAPQALIDLEKAILDAAGPELQQWTTCEAGFCPP